MMALLVRYLLAAGMALAGAACVLFAVADRLVAVGGTDLPLAYVLPPVAGLALFQLVFGMLTGLWRGWRFWAAALPLSALIWGSGLVLLLDGRIDVPTALAGTATGHVLAGLAALAGAAPGRTG